MAQNNGQAIMNWMRMYESAKNQEATQEERKAAAAEHSKEDAFRNDERTRQMAETAYQRSYQIYQANLARWQAQYNQLDRQDQEARKFEQEKWKNYLGAMEKDPKNLQRNQQDVYNAALWLSQQKDLQADGLDAAIQAEAKNPAIIHALNNPAAYNFVLLNVGKPPEQMQQALKVTQNAMTGADAAAQAAGLPGRDEALKNLLDQSSMASPYGKQKQALLAQINQDPQAAIAQIHGAMTGPTGGAAAVSQLVGQGTDNPTGRALGNLEPVTAGTITDSKGHVMAVPVAGSSGATQARAFQAFDKFNAGGTAPGVQQRVVAPLTASLPDAGPGPWNGGGPLDLGPPKTARAYAQPEARAALADNPLGPIKPSGPSLLDIVQGTPNPSGKPLFGAKDLQHAIAADGQWNGPRSDEIREKVKGMPLDQVKEKVAFHALRTGIPFEHLWDAGVRGGFIGGGDDAG